MSDNEEKYLGGGGFGSIYLKPCGTIVVKYPLAPNKRTKKLFKFECEILEKLKHPNIIAYLGIQKKDEKGNEKFGILMEYCERGDLENIIFNPKWIYTMKWAITGAEQLFEALDYLWQKKLTHRDIKPSNTFVKDNFLLKLGDFGTVRAIEKTTTGTFDSGTNRYLSPPQFGTNREKPEFDQRMVSHKNDVYSLGLTMWEIIERRLAFHEYIHTNWQGEKSFDRDQFTIDIKEKRLNYIRGPGSRWRFTQLVMKFESFIILGFLKFRCTEFNREMRPNAREILEIFRKSHERDKIWDHPDQLPMESTESSLIRPILFEYNNDKGTMETGTIKQGKNEQISTDAYSPKWLLVSHLQHLYASLSAVDKDVFDKKFPQIISDMAVETFLFHERENQKPLVTQLQPKNDIFAYAKAHLMKVHFSHLRKIANIINKYSYCTPSFLPWHNYTQIKKLIEELEIEQARMLPNRNLSFKLFFSLSQKAEEFLLFEDDPSSPILLKSDFTQPPRKGQWVRGTEKKLCRLGDVEFHLSKMTITIEIAKILTLLEDIKNGIVRQTKDRLSKFVALDESENRSRQIYDQEIENKLKDDYILFQLRNPPRRRCIHKPVCKLENFETLRNRWETVNPTIEIPDGLAISAYSNHRLDYDCIYNACSPCFSQAEDWFGKLMQWADICCWLQILYEDPKECHRQRHDFHDLPDCLIFLQVVSMRDQNGAKYLTLLDHPINYETYEKIWCMNESFNLEEIHVSKIQRWIQEMRPEERRYLLYKAGHRNDPPCLSSDLDNAFQTLDHQGKPLPNIHDQLET